MRKARCQPLVTFILEQTNPRAASAGQKLSHTDFRNSGPMVAGIGGGSNRNRQRRTG